MSFRQGFFVARDLSIDDVPRVLLAAANNYAPANASYERFRARDHDGKWTAIEVLEDIGNVVRWAQAVSLVNHTTTISFFILEGTWNYEVFHTGTHVAGMEFFPHTYPLLRGDLNAAAGLIGCNADVFTRYYSALLLACGMQGELDDNVDDLDPEEIRAYPDDEFEVLDEYAVLDFARRIGVPGDRLSDNAPFGVTAEGDRPKDWSRLPDLL